MEGEARGRDTTAPLVDELKDVLTLWTVTGLQGTRNTQHLETSPSAQQNSLTVFNVIN